MFYFYLLFIFFIDFNLIYSFIHITLYIYCDDYCNGIYLDNNLLDFNEYNYSSSISTSFQKINFTANPGQNLTIMVKNGAGNLGIAAKFIIQSNGNYYYYDTKNNFDLFSYNLTDTISTFSISRFCHKQYYSEICLELDFIICSSNKYGHDNSLVEYYFTIPNEFLHENLYANSDVEIIFQNNFEIRMNEYFSPSISVDDKYIGIYFSKYNDIDIKGKFYDSSSNEINLETINFDKLILYSKPDDYKDMYNEILYYEFTHGDYFEEDNRKKNIYLLICPEYCDYCTSKKICIKTNGGIYFLYNMQLNIENKISSYNLDYLTDNYSFLIFALDNQMDLSNSNLNSDILNYCIDKLKLNTNYEPDYNFVITAYYRGYNLVEFNAYDQQGNYVVNLDDCINNYRLQVHIIQVILLQFNHLHHLFILHHVSLHQLHHF